jgi:hypothetical protein
LPTKFILDISREKGFDLLLTDLANSIGRLENTVQSLIQETAEIKAIHAARSEAARKAAATRRKNRVETDVNAKPILANPPASENGG